ncbi:MAG TPA: hypothetical protein VK638_13360, partial [Edaphobacter sp.]|nr:hypothetical protein [Edaphobacter sp.]
MMRSRRSFMRNKITGTVFLYQEVGPIGPQREGDMSGISPVHSAFPQEVVTEPEPSMSAQPPQGNAPPGGNLPPAYAPPQGNAPPAGGVPAYTSNAGPGETVVPYSQQLPASHTSANPGAASS